jgi:hypothetical protein
MPDNDEIHNQQRLLKTYRQTLAIYLEQQAKLGAAYLPPGIAHGIREARDEIQRIKRIFRAWNIPVEDLPDDGDKIYTDLEHPKSMVTQNSSLTYADETSSINQENTDHDVIVSPIRTSSIYEQSINVVSHNTSMTEPQEYTDSIPPVPMAIIEPVNGSSHSVLSNALEFGCFTGYGMTWSGGLPLSSGVTVAFDKMKRLEILGSIDREGEYSYTKDIRVRITLNNNRVYEDHIIKSRPRLQGSTDIGPLNIGLADIKQVTFGLS